MSKRAQRANVDAIDRTAFPAGAGAAETAGAPLLIPGGSISRIIRLNWKLIALLTIAGAGIAWVASAVQPAEYRASALAAVAPLAEELPADEALRGVEVLERRTVVATVAALASTSATRAQAGVRSGYEISAVVLPNTNLFRVDVTGRDGAQATAAANRIPQVLGDQTRAMYRYYGVTVVSPAIRPDDPFRPRTARAVAAGLLIGLFIGLVAAYALEWRHTRRAGSL